MRLCTFYQCAQIGELISHLGRHELSCSQVPSNFRQNCCLTYVWVHTFRQAIFLFALELDKRSIVDSLVTPNSSSKLRKLLYWMYHTRTIRPLISNQFEHITFGLVCGLCNKFLIEGLPPGMHSCGPFFMNLKHALLYIMSYIYIYFSQFNFLLTLLFHCRLDKHCLRVYDYHIWWLGSLRWTFCILPLCHGSTFYLSRALSAICLFFMSAVSAFCTCTSIWCWFSLLVD
jgi:hypothetical protein